MTPCLMVQGTSSDAGKSILVTGLCRMLQRRGIAVAPFKPQNMALNSAVTCDGGEIGRAQALQAQAAGLAPHSDMNPVLLKPSTDTAAQVIIHGRVASEMQATDYHAYKRIAMTAVMESWQRLCERYEAVIVEGAGSPAEINLREGDIANMGFAEAADCPVILIADIDRGGVFAQLVGTLELLSESERDRVAGFVINRFRGDLALLEPGLEWLQQRTNKPVLGVLPYLERLQLDAEDALTSEQELDDPAAALKVIVPVLPRISNHTDFDPLRHHPQVNFQFVGPGQRIPAADLIVLPGSKSVRADLRYLQDNNWPQAINRHLRYGGKLLGICAGLQMLGESICDEQGIEGETGSSPGLALLPMATHLQAHKQLREVCGKLAFADAPIQGYEIHCGESSYSDTLAPLIQLDDGRGDGLLSADGNIAGSYVHGLFDEPAACTALLQWAGLAQPTTLNLSERREAQINRLADAMEQHLDFGPLFPAGWLA